MKVLQGLLWFLLCSMSLTTGYAQNQDVLYTPYNKETVSTFDANFESALVAMAVYPNTDVVLYDLYTADEVFRISGNTFTASAMAFDEAGDKLVIHYPDQTQVWDMNTFENIALYPTDFYAARDFSFQTETFVVYDNNSLIFKNLEAEVLQEVPYASAPSRLTFSKTGNALFGYSNGQLNYIDVKGIQPQQTLDIADIDNYAIGENHIAIQQTAKNTQGSQVRIGFYDFGGKSISGTIEPKKAFQTFASKMHLYNDAVLFYGSFDKLVVIDSNGGEDTFEFKASVSDFKIVNGVGFAVSFKKHLDLLDPSGNLLTRFYAKNLMSTASYVSPDSDRVAMLVDSVLILGSSSTPTPKQLSLKAGLVNAVAGEQDLMAFATRDQQLRVWDLKSVKERLVINTSQTTFPQFLKLDPSGKLLLAAYPRAHQLMVYDVKTGQEKTRLSLPKTERLTALDFDGTQLLLGTHQGNYAYYTLTKAGFELQREFTQALSNAITGVTISGKKAALGSLGRMLQLRLDLEQEIVNEDVVIGHSGFIHGISYDKTGTYLASADTYGAIHFWEPQKRRLLHSIQLDSAWVKNLSLHDSLYITSSGPGLFTANFYNPLVYQKITDPKPELLVQRANTNAVRKLVFSRDGKLLASDDGSVIKVREVQTGFLISEITPKANTINDIAFLQDNGTLAVASGDSVEFVDAYTGASKKFIDLNTRNRSIHQVEAFPDLNIVVGLNVHGWHYPLLIHSNSGLVLGTLEVNPTTEKDQQIINLIIAPDGKRIATYGNNYIKVFEIDDKVQTTQVAVYSRASPDVSNKYWNDLMRFNAEGTQLAFVEMGSPNQIKVLDIAQNAIRYDTQGKLAVFGFEDELVGMVNSNVNLSSLKKGATSWERMRSEHEHMDLISSLAYDPVNKLYASADIWGNVITWDAATKTPLWQLDRFSNDIYSVDLNSRGDLMAFNAKSGLYLFDLRQFEVKKLEGNNYPYFGTFSKDGTLFFYRSGNDYRVYRPENDSEGMLFSTPVAYEDASGGLLSKDGNILNFKDTSKDELYSYDIKNKQLLTTTNLNEVPGYLSLSVSSVAQKEGGVLELNGTALKRMGDSLLVFNKVHYEPQTKHIIRASKDHFLNLKENKDFLDYRIQYHSKLNAFAPDGGYYAYLEDFHLKIEDLQSKAIVYDQYIQDVRIVDGVFTEDSKSLILGYEDGAVKVLSVPDFKVIHNFLGSTGQLSDMDYRNHFLVILGGDDLIKVFDSEAGYALLYSCTFMEDGEFILFDEKGFYYASKAAREAVAFKKGDEVYPFEQFDLYYNRPDKAIHNLVALGITDSLLQKGYEMAYQKRLSKMGFEETMLSTDFELPLLELLTTDIPATTSEATIGFSIRAEDQHKNLDRILVWVNDVPVYGANGKSIRDQRTRRLEDQIEVNLVSGANKVQVSVVNTGGIESLKRTFVINSTASVPKPDLYLISIGVSSYKNSDYNLKYAAKDARDLSAYTQEHAEDYDTIHNYNLVNEQVTLAEIAKLKDHLKQSRTNDVVMVFFAGHGVLDEEMNYFLGTYDIDFDNPKKNGLAYDGLENLLDGIPALNKLLIIDACHSGEVDQDDATIDGSLTNAKVSGKRGSIVVKSKSKQLGLENSFELMQMLFSDLRRGTGATVISSASGLEYAYEGEAWQNGVFTYAMLEGLKSGACDSNNDGRVQVSELKTYVFDKVSELTNGKQNPTSRKENLEYDFTVW